jgi:hypothetical protein
MIIITRAELTHGVADRWKERYCSHGKWGKIWDGDSEKIYNAIVAANGDPDLIDAAIGNDSWTSTRCDECHSDKFDVIQLGDEPDYESNTVCLCKDCLHKAAEMFPK